MTQSNAVINSDTGATQTQPVLVRTGPVSALTKRALDIVAAFAGLILLMPLFILIAAAIRIDTPGQIIFRQTRKGRNGEPFRIYKFRTMTVLEDGPMVRQAVREDSRVTRVGRFLRRTSLDELPQLLNVLKGEMSLVGPRPHAIVHDEQYQRLIPVYGRRFAVRPGITGWAQVNGARGETATVADMERRVQLDIWYVHNWGLLLDLKILARTALIEVSSRTNTY